MAKKKIARNSGKKPELSHRQILLIGLVALAIVLVLIMGKPYAPDIARNTLSIDTGVANSGAQYSYLQNHLFAADGFDTKVVLGDIVPSLVRSGVIDLDKFRQIYGNRLTEEQLRILTEPSNQPLVLTPENANFMLNILWPLGIANKNPVLDSFSSYRGVANLASTGGWTLSKENAVTYLNKLELINLTPEQQANLEEVAKNVYRPCCDNPTAFPDCNHGAALLALLELGASQGMSKGQLYSLALQANTLWFPQHYLSIAVLYKMQDKDYWSNAKDIMGYNYSSISGWIENVYTPLQERGLLPASQGGGSCGV